MIRTFQLNGITQVGYYYDLPTSAQEAWELIKLERRLRSQEGGYKVGDHWYHSDQASKIQQMGLVMMGQNMPTGLQWKTLGGSFAQMTPLLAQQIFMTAAQVDGQIFAVAEQKRQQAIQSGDFENFDYFGGWPKAYWEQ